MKQQNESVKRLEIGKDYINISADSLIVIDRIGDDENRGFYGKAYSNSLFCNCPEEWREATEEEVIKAFKKYLIKRYGADWETMKIKGQYADAYSSKNDGLWEVKFSKYDDGWGVYNKNGLLYYNGIWAERLEEEANINKASETQIGGSHYSNMVIQPTEFIHKNGLSFIQGNIIKYVCRYKDKNGIEDLQKAKHYIDLLIEFEEENK